jgi:hypothetical protein
MSADDWEKRPQLPEGRLGPPTSRFSSGLALGAGPESLESTLVDRAGSYSLCQFFPIRLRQRRRRYRNDKRPQPGGSAGAVIPIRQAGELTGARINVPSDLRFPTARNSAKNQTQPEEAIPGGVTRGGEAWRMSSGNRRAPGRQRRQTYCLCRLTSA